MCLLIRQSEGVTISDDWIADFYSKNSDGFGYAYADNNTLYYNRVVGTLDQVKEVYKQVAGREAMLHFRMATHGGVHADNSHPYKVLSGEDGYVLYLAHNGVLSCGNSFDATMSDTYHYIHTYLRPILLENPELFKNPAFKKMVEAHIGSGNKFILMDAYGHIEIYNESAGLEWEANEGKPKVWMSNRYAWNAAKAGLGTTYNTNYGRSAKVYNWPDDDTYYPSYTPPQQKNPPAWAREFATEFFKSVSGTYQRAWQKLSYQQMWDFAEAVGEPDCKDLIADIKSNLYTADEIIEFVELILSPEPKETKEVVVEDKRMEAHEFFSLLTRQWYGQAHNALRVTDVNSFLSDATDTEYEELVTGIEMGTVTDTGVVDAVLAYAMESV